MSQVWFFTRQALRVAAEAAEMQALAVAASVWGKDAAREWRAMRSELCGEPAESADADPDPEFDRPPE